MREWLLCSSRPFLPFISCFKGSGRVLFLSLHFPLFHDPFEGDGVNAGSSFIAHVGVLHAESLQSISSSCPTKWQQGNDWSLFRGEAAEGTQWEAIAAQASGLIWLDETETGFQSRIQFATWNIACGVKQNQFPSVFLQPSGRGRQYPCRVSLSRRCRG